MKKALLIVFFTTLLAYVVQAKTLEQKKTELKKIYEAGGISKVEYDKAFEFIEEPEKKEKKTKKKIISLKNKKDKKNSINLFKKKDEDLEKITLEKINELGKPVKFDDSYFTKSMIKKLTGCNNSFKCKGSKAGKALSKTFSRSKSYGQKNPGEMIKAMAWFEVFYASKLWTTRKALERYKENNYKKDLFKKKKKDEKAIRSLFGINKGRLSMRNALGMNSKTPTKEAIKKFWLLGEFLDLGKGVENEKLDKDLKERQELLEAYKLQIANLKKKLQDDKDKEENEKSVE